MLHWIDDSTPLPPPTAALGPETELPGLVAAESAPLSLGPAEARWLTLALRVPPQTVHSQKAGAHEIHFTIERLTHDDEAARTLREKSTFMIPR